MKWRINLPKSVLIKKRSALCLAIIMLLNAIIPSNIYGLTAGPSSPEFSSYEPIATSNMVNTFTGDFTYNLPVISIPGPDGAGYALSLSYQSGVNAEQEASWVGFGWTLNPGSINRMVQGVPDDYNEVSVVKYNKARPNISLSGYIRAGTELFGKNLGISGTRSIRINNYTGFYTSYGLNLGVKGIGGLNLNADAKGLTAKANLNPSFMLETPGKKADETAKNDNVTRDKKDAKKKDLFQIDKKKQSEKIDNMKPSAKSFFNANLPGGGDVTRSQSFSKYWGIGINFNASTQFNPATAPIGVEGGYGASINIQDNIDTIDQAANGYIYNKENPDEVENILSDYTVEKSSPFTKRDYHLGIPFGNSDRYLLSGEGLGGSFRYWNDKIGCYYPSLGKSHYASFTLGLETMLGANIGLGLNLGGGYSQSGASIWNPSGNHSTFNYIGNAGSFRFSNDMGGEINTNVGTEIANASLGILGTSLEFLGGLNNDLSIGGTSSDIEYQNKVKYLAYNTRFDKNHSPINLGDVKEETVCAFKITNTDGGKYVYGLPVFNKNEGAYQISTEKIRNNTSENFGSSGNMIYNNHLAYQNVGLRNDGSVDVDQTNATTVMGEYKKTPYVGNYLLTQILTYDYVDVNNDGPDDADYGGWTNFRYKCAFGYVPNNFYKWRSPYTGGVFSENQNSDIYDDMASFSQGEKEVYYLKSIETKSHIAFFVTNKSVATDFPSTFANLLLGSGNERLDGYDANHAQACNNPLVKGNNKSQYLERIVLFAKNRPDKPVKTIHFEYDYSMCRNLPNNINGLYPNVPGTFYGTSGKLTLKKVYFTYEGKFVSKVSPYIFDYQYDNLRDQLDEIKVLGHSRNKYQDIFDYANSFIYEDNNPNYDSQILDAWGCVNMNQKNRNSKLQRWPSQTPFVKQYNAALGKNVYPYDPAAWHLKKITLPSGGEIHVHYEEKDYSHVQDRKAMGLVSLKNNMAQESKDFIINLDDIGVTSTQASAYLDLLKDYFITQNKKIYFKFLYDLTQSNPALDNCHSEYISGWANVEDIVMSGSEITIKLSGDNSGDYTNLPRSACFDYMIENFYGKESNANECEVMGFGPIFSLMDGSGGAQSIRSGARNIFTNLTNKLEILTVGLPLVADYCINLNPELSYLKLPLLHSKRGGGVRVKHLLMFDPGLENGDARLYGQHFEYLDDDGRSSGVATNEPNNMREENALVDFLPRKEQSWYSKITTGEDTKQTEGPLGETLLPSPGIGYSKVKVTNIHEGQSGTGYSTHEFFTCKDFPYDKLYTVNANTDIQNGKGVDFTVLEDNYSEIVLNLPLVFLNYSINQAYASQGYRFIVNNMHGQPKSNSTYGVGINGDTYLLSKEEMEYFNVGERIPIMKEDLTIKMENPGKETEVAMERKKIYSDNFDLELEADVSIGAWPPVFVTIVPTIGISNSGIATHITSKVINYPSVLKKVKVMNEGTFSSMENIAFNTHTGKPLIQKVMNDQLKGGKITYSYSVELPASYKYSEMGPKSPTQPGNENRLTEMSEKHILYDHNPIATQTLNLSNLTSSSVSTYTTGQLQGGQFYETGPNPALDTIWRMHKSYVYNDHITNASTQLGNKINNAGIISNYTPFDLSNVNPKWINSSEITKYSKNGQPIEEKNALGIFSAALLGHNELVTKATAVNAQYDNVYFNSFEDLASGVSMDKAHTGIKSIKILSGASYVFPNSIFSSEMISRGFKLKFWIHSNNYEDEGILLSAVNGVNYTSKFIAKSGEWALHEIKVPPGSGPALTFFEINNTSFDLYLDDVKVQPLESEMKCYVHDDETLKLIAQLDDNHFALLYQYNDEGKLVRKMIETEKGIQTLQETQYNTPRYEK